MPITGFSVEKIPENGNNVAPTLKRTFRGAGAFAGGCGWAAVVSGMVVVNVEEKETVGQRIEEKGQRRYIRDGPNLNN